MHPPSGKANSFVLNMTATTQLLSLYISRIDTRHVGLGYYNKNTMTDSMVEAYEDNLKDFMIAKFVNGNIGSVDHIDLISKQTFQGFWYYIAFVHFKEWYNTDEANNLQKDVLDEGTKAQFRFSEKGSYWICNKNTNPNKDKPKVGPTMSPQEMMTLIEAQNQTIAALEETIAALESRRLSAAGMKAEFPNLPKPTKLRRTDNSDDVSLGGPREKVDWANSAEDNEV